jgi:hypothetical protein
MILVGWIAVGARHARRAAPARMLAVPGETIVRLANPVGVAAAGALHCTPQDRPLSHHSAARSTGDAAWRRSELRDGGLRLTCASGEQTTQRGWAIAKSEVRHAEFAAVGFFLANA